MARPWTPIKGTRERNMLKTYELVVLLHPDLEIDVDTPISKIEKLAETAGGKITKRDNWGKRRTAYQVKHQDFAVYVFFELQLEPLKVPDFERGLLLADEVMRHLLVQKEDKQPQAKPKKARTANAAVAASEEASSGEEL